MKSLKKLLIGLFALSALSVIFVSCPNTPEENIEVASVTFSPDTESIKPGETVNLSTTTEGADVYYSKTQELTSSNFTEGSMGFSVDISTDSNATSETIYAIAVYTSSATGKTYTSQPSSKTYQILQVPSKVTFTPEAGPITSGTKVKLTATSPLTDDTVTIYYSIGTELNENNYANDGNIYYNSSDGIEVTSAQTIYAIAVGKNGSGAVSSATYSLPLVKLTAAPQADDVVYIYYPTGRNVMLSTASGSELSSATVTLTDNTFSATSNMAALTVFKNEIGQYVFVSGGKYLTTTTRNNLTLSDTFTVFALWEVAALSGDSTTFYIHSANSIYNNTRQGLEYYKNKFSVYDRKTEAIYQFQFYKDPNKTSELNDEAKAALKLQANSLATPKFSISSTPEGETIVPGLVTYLLSDSLDVDFYYTTDGTEITGDNYGTKISTDPPTAYKYNASEGIKIEGSSGDKKTINAIAVKTVSEGEQTRGIFSLPASAVYKLGADTNTYLKKVTTLSDNDVVAIYYPTGKTTISSTFSTTSGKGFSGTAATMNTNGLVLSEGLTQFTVKKLGESGYVFVNGGKYLSFDGTNTMVLADAFTDNSVWNLEKAGTSEDSFYIKNTGDTTKYIEFYNVFTVYSFQSSNTPIYTFQFYKNENPTVEEITLPLLPVKFDPAGGTVEANATISLTSNNGEGTEIYYMWQKDGTLSKDNYNSEPAKKYDNNGKPTATENGTLQAIAVNNDKTSEVSTATYSVLAVGQSSETVDFSTASLTDNTGTDIKTGNNNDGYESIIVSNTALGTSVRFDKGTADGKSTYPKFSNSKDIRFMNGNTLTISNTSKKITNIEFTFGSSKQGTITADKGSYTSGQTTWTGSENSVVFTKSGSSRFDIKSIKIFYAE